MSLSKDHVTLHADRREQVALAFTTAKSQHFDRGFDSSHLLPKMIKCFSKAKTDNSIYCIIGAVLM